MNLTRVPFDAALQDYEDQAAALLAEFRSGDAEAVQLFHENHPRFLDEKIPWLPKRLSDDEIRSAPLELSDARLALARWYCFRDWSALAEYERAVAHDPAVRRFEAAVEAVVAGDAAALGSGLREHPDLVRARSTRVTNFDPPVHRAALLHYLAANGVESYRQKSPPNAVGIARMLLEAGAEVDALAELYGTGCTTMTLLVSSTPPAQARVQVPLIHTLLDFGAAIEGQGTRKWGTPLITALIFVFPAAAEALAARGARTDNVMAAAGLGRAEDTARLLADAEKVSRHFALSLAAQHGHAAVVRVLLEGGEDADRYNPEGGHAHSTPLHQAALAGHDAVVRTLVEHGARLDIKDTIYQGTPLDWAVYAGHNDIAEYLRARGARSAREG